MCEFLDQFFRVFRDTCQGLQISIFQGYVQSPAKSGDITTFSHLARLIKKRDWMDHALQSTARRELDILWFIYYIQKVLKLLAIISSGVYAYIIE